jgi:uncharacterized protein YjdB
MIKSKLTGVFCVLVLLAVVFTGCPTDSGGGGGDGGGGTTPVSVTGVTLKAGESISGESIIYFDSTSADLPKSITLTATVVPANATNKTVTWSAESNEFFTLTSSGSTATITGIKKGGPKKVTVKTAEGGKTAEWSIDVKSKSDHVSVSNIAITNTPPLTFTKPVGGAFSPATIQLTFTLTPENATNKGVSWSASPEGIVTVDNNGLVTPLKNGTATVTITSDEKSTISDSVSIKVDDQSVEDVHVSNVTIVLASGEAVPATGLAFNKAAGGEFIPANIQLGVSVLPADASDKTVGWSSNNESVATVSDNGVVTPKAVGNAVITATSNDEPTKKATVNVTVTEDIAPSQYTLKLVNQSSSPTEGTTTTLPEMDATTKRYTIANAFDTFSSSAWTGAGWGGGSATTGVTGTTVLYLDKALGNNASISARVRITQAFGTPANSGGLIFGMFSNPVGASNIQFSGLRAGTDGTVAIYMTRDQGSSGGINNSATQFGTSLTGSMDDEYIFTVTRTDAQNYTLKVADANGTQLRSQDRGGAAATIIDLGNVYPGFIIARAKVEISQITVTEGTAGTVIYQSGASDPTVFPVESVEFTAPVVAGADGEYTYIHSTSSGDLSLAISAIAKPARATDKTINWTVGSGASLSQNTGNDVTVTFDSALDATVEVTASSGTKSARLTITVKAGAVSVESINIAAPSDTSIMSGFTQPDKLQLSATILPSAATQSVTWSVWGNEAGTSTTSAATISSTGDKTGVLAASSTDVGTDTDVWVFAEATDGSGIRSTTGTKITIKKYVAPIFRWVNGDTLTGNINTSATINGKTVTKLNGTFSVNSSGDIVFPATGRLIIGASHSTAGAISTTSTSFNGQLDLSKKFRVRVTYTVTATSGNFRFGLNNTSNNGDGTIFGSGGRIQSNPGAVGNTVTLTATWDPATLNMPSGAGGGTWAAWSTANSDALKTSFMFLGTESNTAGTISKILIEYID